MLHAGSRAASASDDPPDPLANTFLPLAVDCFLAIVLLTLTAFGPRWWASQHVDSGSIALEIVAVGQLALAVIAWPIWTRSAATSLAIIASSIAWLLLAGQIAQRANGDVLSIGWKVAAALSVLALVRLAAPRAAVGFAWTLIAAIALGTPTMLYLARDY